MTPLLEARELTFGYRKGEPILRGISVRLDAGERLGVAGGNGAGKTTLLWCLLGLLPAEGSIRLFGERVTRKSWRRIGVVFQNPEDQLFMPSILDDAALPLLNRGLAPAEARPRAMEALEVMGLAHEAERPAAELSLGQRKRAALAAALAPEPELLLLDEPTAELDRPSARRLAELLRSTHTACLITSHDLDFLGRTVHRLALLASGRILACGPVAEVLSNGRLLEDAGVL